MEKLKVGEVVELVGNPLDEQLGEFIPMGFKTITEVLDVPGIPGILGTSGQWVKIEEYNDWLDSTWFTKTN